MADDELTLSVGIDLSQTADDLRSVAEKLHKVADEIEEDEDA